jgi:hypothetical protein
MCLGAVLLTCSAQSVLPAAPPAPAMSSAPAVPTAPSLPAAPALGSPFGSLPLHSESSGTVLHGKGRELPERLATPMHGPAQSLADVVAEETAWVPASRPLAVPFRVSLSPSASLQTPVSASPSSPPAPVRWSAAGAPTRNDSSLFLAGDDEEGEVPMDLSPSPNPRSRACGHVSPVRPAAAAATAAAAPADSSRDAHGAPSVPSCAAPVVIDLDDEESVRSSVRRARAAVLTRAVGCVSASATRLQNMSFNRRAMYTII